MKTSFLERHHLAAFLVLVAGGLVLATVGRRAPGALRGVQDLGLTLVGPFARAGSALGRSTGDAWTGLAELARVHEELGVTRRENRDLRLLLVDRGELAAENRRLRRLLELGSRTEYATVPATIVHQETSPDRILVIGRGASAGLREDLSVVVPEGVVGKVLSVAAGSAKVLCLTDPSSGVAVLVGPERRQADAVVKAARGGRLLLRHLDLLARVEEGDPVVTSGLDLVHPKGWPVGTVASVEVLSDAEREITVRPAVAFDRLEEVLVLRELEHPEARALSAAARRP